MSSTTTPPSTPRAVGDERAWPEVPTEQRVALLKLARDAYRGIGAEGFARMDFLVAGESIYLSEINTIPGFTPISLFPTLPAEGGYTFAAVCVRIVELAIERHATRVGDPLRPETCPDELAATTRRRASVPARRGHAPSGGRRPGLSRVRAGAALALLVAAAAIYGVSASSAFDQTEIELTGATFTDPDGRQRRDRGRPRGQNLFTLQTGPLEAALRDLPTIEIARVTVSLPHTLDVTDQGARSRDGLEGRRSALPRRC